jgi:uncharacterized membrane protein
MASESKDGNRIAPPRFLLFFAIFAAGVPIAWQWLQPTLAVLAAFDVAAIGFFAASATLLNDEAQSMRDAARKNDGNRFILLLLSAILSFVILVAVAGELTAERKLSTLEAVVVVGTLMLAWTFGNTVYALHYAHLYYSGDDGGNDQTGIDFPGKRPEPDYWDFLYFSFTLGVALQTSDVCITSPHIRRIVTLHCVAAFIYNLVVLALAVNVLAA